MTKDEADTEAKRRWGDLGAAWLQLACAKYVFTVGVYASHEQDSLRTPKGHGDTWEEAFAHADKAERFDLGRPG